MKQRSRNHGSPGSVAAGHADIRTLRCAARLARACGAMSWAWGANWSYQSSFAATWWLWQLCQLWYHWSFAKTNMDLDLILTWFGYSLANEIWRADVNSRIVNNLFDVQYQIFWFHTVCPWLQQSWQWSGEKNEGIEGCFPSHTTAENVVKHIKLAPFSTHDTSHVEVSKYGGTSKFAGYYFHFFPTKTY